jgi:glycosidase
LTALGGDTLGARVAATILLTLPGVPFVYYGEEIGMTGDKPDERLRTPMQWARTSAGFTRGKPWEPPQSDSLVHNVADEERAPTSLLTLYRRLVQLRARNDALRDGDFTPVETGSESVLAYLRKAPSGEVLVVANLGNQAAAPFALPGRFTLRSLLRRGANRSSLPTLEPRQAYVYEVTRRP